MKWFMAFVICLTLIWAEARAETRYVGDLTEITFRTGPGTDYKIIEMLKSGQKVEVVQAGDDWTKVRLPSETEGWVLTRLISPNPPPRLLLDEFKQRNAMLTRQAASLLEENTRIKAEKETMAEELASQRQLFSELKNSYETLKKDSAEYLTIKSIHEKTTALLAQRTKQIEKLEEEITNLKLSHNIKWFLSGAGVLFLGFLIGLSAKRQRKRTSLLSLVCFLGLWL